LRLFSFGGYGLAPAALALVVFSAIECPPLPITIDLPMNLPLYDTWWITGFNKEKKLFAILHGSDFCTSCRCHIIRTNLALTSITLPHQRALNLKFEVRLVYCDSDDLTSFEPL